MNTRRGLFDPLDRRGVIRVRDRGSDRVRVRPGSCRGLDGRGCDHRNCP